MSNLDEYVEQVKKYKQKNPNMPEVELIRHVYFELAKRFSFNDEFYTRNSKYRDEVYKRSRFKEEMEKSMETNIVICRSAAYILEYVLKAIGINIKTVVLEEDHRRQQHIYNIIYPKDGSEPYSIDLQDDMYNIQAHSFTKNFGLSLEDGKPPVISRVEQEQMDRKSGYISDENYYADDYVYLLKQAMDYFDDFGEKVEFVLENLDFYETTKLGYTDRKFYHAHKFEEIFTNEEFNLENNNKIRLIDCYKEVNGKRRYVNCVTVQNKGKVDMYVYNQKTGKYNQIDFMKFANAIKNGLVILENISGMKRAVRELKTEEEEAR